MKIEKVLERFGIKHEVTSFIESNVTRLDGNTLYYKSIPSALLLLNHYNLYHVLLEDDRFDIKGTMIDLSRNAVFTVDYFKSVIEKQALLGFNEIWLYMEDVYELEKYPKFGYLRGKYTLEDLITLDHFASDLGVTLVPCIQTLGHMGQFLRWSSSGYLKDQSDVLLITTAHDLINDMIAFCKKAFKTDKIHVGMDETFGFSLGNYYKKHGYKNPEDLFIEHLGVVNDICQKHQYKDVYIWSDMFFRHRSETNSYYDYTITFDDMIKKIPKQVGLVYWDYYNTDLDVYKKMLAKHQQMGRKVIMASGTWIWTKLAYDHKKTKMTASKAIEASKSLGIKEIIFTQWQDDGAYVDYDTSFLGLFDVTSLMVKDKLDKRYLKTVTNRNHQDYMYFSSINDCGFYPIQLLWDDLLLGIYLNDLVGYDFNKITPLIACVNKQLRKIKQTDHKHHKLIAEVLRLKLEIRQLLLKGYFESKDFSLLNRKLTQFKTKMKALTMSFEDMWHDRYKPFGLEIIQTRLYAQIRRADEVTYWVKAYTNHQVDHIPFLEETISKEGYLPVKHIDLAFSSKQ